MDFVYIQTIINLYKKINEFGEYINNYKLI